MQRSTVIATCLVNSGMIHRLEDAERAVGQVFAEEFPHEQFDAWNRPVDDRAADRIISAVGCASHINVRLFIDDLRGV